MKFYFFILNQDLLNSQRLMIQYRLKVEILYYYKEYSIHLNCLLLQKNIFFYFFYIFIHLFYFKVNCNFKNLRIYYFYQKIKHWFSSNEKFFYFNWEFFAFNYLFMHSCFNYKLNLLFFLSFILSNLFFMLLKTNFFNQIFKLSFIHY